MQEEKESTRVEAFSDGIFAIAITLLVLGIKVPSHESVLDRGLAHALILLWPAYLAFFISFITILVIWVQHHVMFMYVRKVDHSLLYWNGLLLLAVTFVPFPTGLLAEHLSHPDAKLAAHMYTGNLLAIYIVFYWLWRHVLKSGKVLAEADGNRQIGELERISKYARIAPILYLGAFALSFASEFAGIFFCIILAFLISTKGWPNRR